MGEKYAESLGAWSGRACKPFRLLEILGRGEWKEQVDVFKEKACPEGIRLFGFSFHVESCRSGFPEGIGIFPC